MTTIAWDGRTLAADKQAEYGGTIQVVTKIFRAGDCLVGGAGETAFIAGMVEWVKAGRIAAEFPASQRDKDDWQPVMVIEPDGSPVVYERTPYPVRWERKNLAAIGSGKHFALAAMACGRDAVGAVEVAAEFDPGTGVGIDRLELHA